MGAGPGPTLPLAPPEPLLLRRFHCRGDLSVAADGLQKWVEGEVEAAAAVEAVRIHRHVMERRALEASMTFLADLLAPGGPIAAARRLIIATPKCTAA